MDLPDIAGQLGKSKLPNIAKAAGIPGTFKIPGFDLESAPSFAPPPSLALSSSPGGRSPGGGAEYQGMKVGPTPPSGGFMQLPTSWRSTHPTSGLSDEGYTHAIDLMGRPGTDVGAPVSGRIVRHGSAQGGESMYFQGDDGRTYWIGHIANILPPGTRVKRGQVIARISADHAAPHVHLDYR